MKKYVNNLFLDVISGLIASIILSLISFFIGYFSKWKAGYIVLISIVTFITTFILLFCYLEKNKISKSDCKYINLAHKLGIKDFFNGIDGTEFQYSKCCEMSNLHKLDVMCVSGAKWLGREEVSNSKNVEILNTEQYKKFSNMLNNVRLNRGKVRFLLLNPYCEQFKQYSNSNKENDFDEKIYEYWKSLEDKYDCLEVHVYSFSPLLRLQFINDSKLLLAGYNIGKSKEELHMEIDTNEKEGENSLFQSYVRLYDYFWENTKTLEEAQKSEISKRLYNEYDTYQNFVQNAAALGIETFFEDINDSYFGYEKCCRMRNLKELDVMCVSGAKWLGKELNKTTLEQDIKNTRQYSAFINLLKSIKYRRGKVRFLLLNPYCYQFDEFVSAQGRRNFDVELYSFWQELEKKFECLEIHVYSCHPMLRLQFIDNNLLVSSYSIGSREKLMFMKVSIDKDGTKENSLYHSFSRLYEYMWQKTETLSEVIEKHYNENGGSKNER